MGNTACCCCDGLDGDQQQRPSGAAVASPLTCGVGEGSGKETKPLLLSGEDHDASGDEAEETIEGTATPGLPSVEEAQITYSESEADAQPPTPPLDWCAGAECSPVDGTPGVPEIVDESAAADELLAERRKPPAYSVLKPNKRLIAVQEQEMGRTFTRNNSTSSLYIRTTLQETDLDQLIRCMAKALQFLIEKNTQLVATKKIHSIFSEKKYPLSTDKTKQFNPAVMPTYDVIFQFLRHIFVMEMLDPEVAIMSLVFVERLTKGNTALCPETWRRLTLSTLLVASKVWEDKSIWNSDYVGVFDNLTPEGLQRLERKFLNLVGFSVGVSRSEYLEYFLCLKTFSNDFPLKPLSKDHLLHLETSFQKQAMLSKSARSLPLTKLEKQMSLGDVSFPHGKQVVS
eukprot:TRINITY_DN2311_c0_g1_i1.p1 TRINITY_DN2311_c0_g1~~TRINITY_DN2311_c0_g1_i1.p1  ORF type:complete len:400 (+),score=118.51 TRINITY_DN2311_c0_g1_i1:31-1230(+)